MTVIDIQKQGAQRLWAEGNYAVVGQLLVEAALRLISAAGIRPGMSVLDVGTGTGNVAIPAAKVGASVTGLDLTPEMLDKAHARARAAGAQVEWVLGDAEQLPFPDESFDVVLSTFGVQFAPDQQRAAAELLRVCRPGGRIGLCCWTPEGVAGRYISLLGRHLGGRSDGRASTDWGCERSVRELFSGSGAELTFERDHVLAAWGSLDESVTFLEDNYGCAITARQMLEPAGRWQSLRSDICDLFASSNQAADGSLLLAEEYLRTIVRKPL